MTPLFTPFPITLSVRRLSIIAMKERGSISSSMYNVSAVTLPEKSAIVNVDEYTSAQATRGKPGFPKQGGQSLSYWLQQVRCDPLLDHRSTDKLPPEADTVIIGSGITGTLVTKHHLETWPGKSVVVLEAREFCSGATGRNAGHCKPDQWRHFARFEQAYGKEQAIKILNNENETWKALISYIREYDVDCDLWVGDTLDVPLDDEVAKIAKAMFERYQEAGGRTGHVKVTHDPSEAAKISRMKNAKACYAWSASTLQPWKLTAHVMRTNLECGANLQTHTIARWVSAGPMGGRKWIVHTDRGEIACNTVVHATNAYSAAIEPSLRGIINPKPHICNMVIPPRSLCGSKAIQNSYNVLLPNGVVYSINPRSSSDGAMMFGGSNPGQKQFDDWIERHPENSINDGFARLDNITKCVQDFVEKELEGWNDAELGPGEGVEHSWSGIEGLSVDGVPFVGELPGKPGQWLCASYQGHGMTCIFTAAPGLVKLMNGEPWASTGLPDVYQMTQSRLESLRALEPPPKVAVV